MTGIDLLDIFHKFVEKSKSLCVKYLDVRKLIKKAQPFYAAARLYIQKFIEKAKAFCAEHVNVKPIDVFLVIAVVIALIYVAVNRAREVVNEAERTTIHISSRCADLFGKNTIDALIQEFETLNPELLIREAAGVNSADIIFFDDSEFGNLINLSDLASRDSYRPLVAFMDLFIYNIDILQAANLDRPPKTRADFLAAAKAIAENDAVSAFALGLSEADPLALRRDFYPWIWAGGVDINSIDLSGDNPALPRAVTDVIALFEQLNREGWLAPESLEKTGARRLQEFADGKIAMMTISARDLAFLRNGAHGITFGITSLPTSAQGKYRLGISSIYAAVNSDSAVSDEAKVFLAFLVKKSGELAEAIEAVPGSFPGGFAGDHIAKDPMYSKGWEIFEAAEVVEYKGGQPSEETFNRLVREKLIEAVKKIEPVVEPPPPPPPPVEAPKAEPANPPPEAAT